MRKPLAIALPLLAAAALLLVTQTGRGQTRDPDTQNFGQIARGHYLATLSDCLACHTRKGDKEPFAGGRPIETPFGIIVSPNITPDMETGIGNWSAEDFDNAVRRGIRRDGSRMYPAMPYPFYTKMSAEDVRAIRAYLMTVAPVRNPVVANQLPFPFNIRTLMLAWNTLFFQPGEYKTDPNRSPQENRGAFLVDGPGHCGACHTPKNFLGGDKTSEYLQGSLVQGWFAPDITSDASRGVGTMSVEDIAILLKTGHNHITGVSGPMGEQVSDSSSHFSDEDLAAIAVYLKSVPGRGNPPQPVAENDARMTAGKAIYRDVCSACHGIDGKGVPNLFPALAQAPQVRAPDATSMIRVLLRGTRSVATAQEPTAPAMPSYAWQLDDAQAAAVLTYIRNSWGSAAPAVAPEDVGKLRSGLANRSD